MEEAASALGRGLESLLRSAEGEQASQPKSEPESPQIIIEDSNAQNKRNKVHSWAIHVVDGDTKRAIGGIEGVQGSGFSAWEFGIPRAVSIAACVVGTAAAALCLLRLGSK